MMPGRLPAGYSSHSGLDPESRDSQENTKWLNMPCKNKDIKELLPAYAGEELGPADITRVEGHLRACADCAREAAILRMMSDEPVPDPGDAFWTAMPERIYRAVQRERAIKPRHRVFDLLHSMTFPRWAGAAAAVGIILIVALLLMHSLRQQTPGPLTAGDEYSLDDASNRDPVLRHTSTTIAELTPSEVDAVDAWASTELTSIAREADANAANMFDTDLSEDLAELDSHEVDRFSTLLNDLEEG